VIEILGMVGGAMACVALGYAIGRRTAFDSVRAALTVAPLTTWVPRRVDTLDDGSRIVFGLHAHGMMYPLAAGDPARCRCGAVLFEYGWYYPERALHDAMAAVMRVLTPYDLGGRGTACVACGGEIAEGDWREHEHSDQHRAVIAAIALANGVSRLDD